MTVFLAVSVSGKTWHIPGTVDDGAGASLPSLKLKYYLFQVILAQLYSTPIAKMDDHI